MLESGDVVKVSKSVSFPRFPEGTVGVITHIQSGKNKIYHIKSGCADGYLLGTTCGYAEDELEFLCKGTAKLG